MSSWITQERLFTHLNLLFILLFIAFFITTPDLLAQGAVADDDVSNRPEFPSDENKPAAVRPVEAGAGGNIKIERKYRTRAESLYEWHAHLLWESRYVTEGRDNLSGKGLISASTEFSLDDISIVPWFAYSPATDYKEANLNFVAGAPITDELVVYAGYSYLQAYDQGKESDDNEISLDLIYKWYKHLHFLASVYHSFEANGSFLETTIKYNNTINKKIFISIQGALGINAEYVSDGHNGLNHFQLRANAAYNPLPEIELYAYIGYNIAIDSDPINYIGDESLEDFLWTAIGFSYRF